MKSLVSDAKGFVEGVVTELRAAKKSSAMEGKVESLLLKMTSRAKKEQRAVVYSASPLTASEEKDIASLLARVSGHDVSIDVVIEPELIAGVRIQMADWVMDISMGSQLQKMGRLLISE